MTLTPIFQPENPRQPPRSHARAPRQPPSCAVYLIAFVVSVFIAVAIANGSVAVAPRLTGGVCKVSARHSQTVCTRALCVCPTGCGSCSAHSAYVYFVLANSVKLVTFHALCFLWHVCRAGAGVSASDKMTDTLAFLVFPGSSSCNANQYTVPTYSQGDIVTVR